MNFRNRQVIFDTPKVMGILNVTPDSFSDGGKFSELELAIRQAESMVKAGATFIDVGGESTRPGAVAVSLNEELDRVIPVIEKISNELDVVISVDTSKAQVMAQAVQSGAGMINDVRALRNEGALRAAINAANDFNVPSCLMHMQGDPQSMQEKPQYHGVVEEVMDFFEQRIAECETAGLERRYILIDPGFGFGKTLQHNLALNTALDRFVDTGHSLLLGVSRKSMIGQLINSNMDNRLVGSVIMALLMAQSVAARQAQVNSHSGLILRVHDVLETVQALTIWQATRAFKEEDNQ